MRHCLIYRKTKKRKLPHTPRSFTGLTWEDFGPHGRRERLRARFEKSGLDGFADYIPMSDRVVDLLMVRCANTRTWNMLDRR